MATPILPVWPSPTKQFTANEPITVYDAVTDVFSIGNSALTHIAFSDSSAQPTPLFDLAVTDGASFSLTADINESGSLGGGLFSISGGISDLGIPGGSLLLAGSLVDFALVDFVANPNTGQAFVFTQFLVQITHREPQLNWPEFAVIFHSFDTSFGIQDYPVPPVTRDNIFFESWDASHSLNTYVYDYAISVSAPNTLALLALGLLGLATLSWRRCN
jgi:hypothetical protein